MRYLLATTLAVVAFLSACDDEPTGPPDRLGIRAELIRDVCAEVTKLQLEEPPSSAELEGIADELDAAARELSEIGEPRTARRVENVVETIRRRIEGPRGAPRLALDPRLLSMCVGGGEG